ncbi:MAG: apolipoprotein N-acyltransferase [Neisseriaceae bacterium]|nr:MAG: apolipoprotein N-acyltransferase [Neisseriaceae bacterium]
MIKLFEDHTNIIFGGIAFCAGALTILGFAPFRYFLLIPLLLGVLFFFIYFYPKKAVKYAYLWGLGVFITHCYWINTAINVFGGVPKYLSIPLSLLLPIYLAIYPMLAVWITKKFAFSKQVQIVLILPMVWVVLEFVRERLFTGFGWGTLGYSQAVNSPLIGYASIGGILLVTYVVVLVTALLFYLFIEKNNKSKMIVSILTIVLIGLGQILKSINFTQHDGNITKVGIAQINIPQDVKFNYPNVSMSINQIYTIIADYPDVDILFFPETSIPIAWENLSFEEKQKFIDYAQKYQTSLALGVLKEISTGENLLYNSVIGIDPVNEVADLNDFPFYAKRHLVPFGEYKPIPIISNYIFNALNISMGEIKPGSKEQILIPLSNQYVALNICYEEGFGDELINLARHASLIANETNMAWYGSSYAMDLQLQQGQARAVELGRYVVRATNTGYSAILDNKGKIISYLPRDKFGVLIGEVKGFLGQTPYMKIGGSFYWIFTLFLLLLALFFYSRIKNKSQKGILCVE